ncbi:hypothetical protein Q3G72_033986 [Acer saccharum]|nr:hypothetical protein Q3G72_033986 [Acer saccharum]
MPTCNWTRLHVAVLKGMSSHHQSLIKKAEQGSLNRSCSSKQAEQRIELLNSVSQLHISTPFQIYNRTGHSAIQCYNRYISEFSQQSKSNASRSVACKEAFEVVSTSLLATPETVHDLAWSTDSGSTSHVTSDLCNRSNLGNNWQFAMVVIL